MKDNIGCTQSTQKGLLCFEGMGDDSDGSNTLPLDSHNCWFCVAGVTLTTDVLRRAPASLKFHRPDIVQAQLASAIAVREGNFALPCVYLPCVASAAHVCVSPKLRPVLAAQ